MSNRTKFDNDSIAEVYVHPDYDGEVLLDNSVSIYGHNKLPLVETVSQLKKDDIELISWLDIE